ncbi:unnamed protein product [Amoebophrya sp. A120]|nr:unnamed protein product [Amoebophrya sp. A120]|eukprot:GSA120T00022283001.1
MFDDEQMKCKQSGHDINTKNAGVVSRSRSNAASSSSSGGSSGNVEEEVDTSTSGDVHREISSETNKQAASVAGDATASSSCATSGTEEDEENQDGRVEKLHDEGTEKTTHQDPHNCQNSSTMLNLKTSTSDTVTDQQHDPHQNTINQKTKTGKRSSYTSRRASSCPSPVTVSSPGSDDANEILHHLRRNSTTQCAVGSPSTSKNLEAQLSSPLQTDKQHDVGFLSEQKRRSSSLLSRSFARKSCNLYNANVQQLQQQNRRRSSYLAASTGGAGSCSSPLGATASAGGGSPSATSCGGAAVAFWSSSPTTSVGAMNKSHNKRQMVKEQQKRRKSGSRKEHHGSRGNILTSYHQQEHVQPFEDLALYTTTACSSTITPGTTSASATNHHAHAGPGPQQGNAPEEQQQHGGQVKQGKEVEKRKSSKRASETRSDRKNRKSTSKDQLQQNCTASGHASRSTTSFCPSSSASLGAAKNLVTAEDVAALRDNMMNSPSTATPGPRGNKINTLNGPPPTHPPR